MKKRSLNVRAQLNIHLRAFLSPIGLATVLPTEPVTALQDHASVPLVLCVTLPILFVGLENHLLTLHVVEIVVSTCF